MAFVGCRRMPSIFSQVEYYKKINLHSETSQNPFKGKTVSKPPTFGIDTNPVQVPRQLFGNVGFASGREAHHGNDMRTVDIVSSLPCNSNTMVEIKQTSMRMYSEPRRYSGFKRNPPTPPGKGLTPAFGEQQGTQGFPLLLPKGFRTARATTAWLRVWPRWGTVGGSTRLHTVSQPGIAAACLRLRAGRRLHCSCSAD